VEGHPRIVRRLAAAGRSRTAAAVLAAGLLAGTDCGWPPQGGAEEAPRPADRADIRRLGDAFVLAYGEGDAERLAALFTADAVLVPSDDATCEGREEIADYLDDLLRDAPATPEFEVQETRVLGGWAFERIDVTLVWNDPDTGEETESWERYFWVLQRQTDGTWKIARLMVNAEEPGEEDEEDAGDGRKT
jgi:uncharacterized protein (TIGR02246 family)